MQNKANFRKAQMNINKVLTKDYEKRILGERGKNKPNQSQFQVALLFVSLPPSNALADFSTSIKGVHSSF
jgi:hypothetical protein